MPVDNHSAEYDALMPRWRRCRDVLQGGNLVVKERTTAYLPQLQVHFDDPNLYTSYLDRAFFNEFARQTLTDLVGMATKKALNTPLKNEKAILRLSDVTGRQTNLSEFFKMLLDDTLTTGRGGILPGWDPRSGRGYLQHYPAESIVNVFYRQNAFGDFHQVIVLFEKEQIFGEDQFEPIYVDQYRVLSLDEAGLYYQQLWRLPEESSTEFEPYVSEFSDEQGRIYTKVDGEFVREIPFCWLGVRGNTADYDNPPLEALVDLSLQYYVTSADYFSALGTMGSPPMVVKGQLQTAPGVPAASNGVAQMAGGSIWYVSENGDVKYLSLGTALEEIRMAMKDLIRMAASQGASILYDEKLGVEAAETVRLRREGQTNLLGSVYASVVQGISKAVNIIFQWEGIKESLMITPETDFFFTPIQPAEVKTYWELVKDGGLPLESFHRKLVDGEVISSTVSLEEFRQKLLSDRSFRDAFLVPGAMAAAISESVQ